MKALKIYLMVMGGLFTFAILAGVVVWFLYQDLPGANTSKYTNDLGALERDANIENSEATPTTPPATQLGGDTPVYTITPDSLTDGQRAVLKSLGLGDSNFEVTQSMITCAETAVGKPRLTEIINGSAPSPLEAMKLLPCMKK